MMPQDAYNELCYYTLSHGRAEFIHQHVVDAFGAQETSPNDKPIRLFFSLVGLYLHVEKGFNGREVQLTHMKLGREKREWPSIRIPENRGSINVESVLAAPSDSRDTMIHEWCRAVWQAYSSERETVLKLLQNHKITDPRSVQPSKHRM